MVSKRLEHLVQLEPGSDGWNLLYRDNTAKGCGVAKQANRSEVVVFDLKCPIFCYIDSLVSIASKATMTRALSSIAKSLHRDSIYDIIWQNFTYASLNRVMGKFRDEGLAPDTIALYLSAIKGVCKHAFLLQLIDVRVFEQIKQVKRPSHGRKRQHQVIKQTEFFSIIDSSSNSDNPALAARDAAIIHLGGAAGLRRNEIVSLTLSQVDMENQVVEIIGKGGKQRFIYLHKLTVAVLQRWLLYRGTQDGPMFVGVHRSGTVYQLYKQDGQPRFMCGDTVYKILQRYGLISEHLHCPPHTLRRSYATWLYDNKVKIKTIAELLGHSSTATTELYIQTKEDEKVRAVFGLFK